MKHTICNVRDCGAVGDGLSNDAPALQAALDSGAATVYVPAGEYRVGDTLRVHSDTHILCDGRARLFLCEKKPKRRGDFLLTNADPTAGNRNITVTGGIWDGNYDGKNNNKPADLFAPDAWSGSTLNFVGVTGLTLEDLDMRNSTVYYIRMARLSRFTIRNIRFSAEKQAFNQDGLHFGGHVYDGLIENITASPGQTNDDLIALNADDSMARLENFDLCRGPIEDVVIRNVAAEDCYTAFRLLSVTSPIRRVTIENVYAGCRHYAVNIDGARYCRTPLVTESEYPRGAGLLSDVTIRNMHVWTTMESGERAMIVCESIPKNVRIDGFTRHPERERVPQKPSVAIRNLTDTVVSCRTDTGIETATLQEKTDTFVKNGSIRSLWLDSAAEDTTAPERRDTENKCLERV